jgi:hypothetical protein
VVLGNAMHALQCSSDHDERMDSNDAMYCRSLQSCNVKEPSREYTTCQFLVIRHTLRDNTMDDNGSW